MELSNYLACPAVFFRNVQYGEENKMAASLVKVSRAVLQSSCRNLLPGRLKGFQVRRKFGSSCIRAVLTAC